MRVALTLYLLTALSGLPATTACAQMRAAHGAQVPSSVRRAAGCYQFLSAGARDSLAHDPFAALPTRFELTDTALAAPLDGWYALHPGTIYPAKKMFATWRTAAPDSVLVGWSTGFYGLALDLSIRGDSLVGYVEPVSDAHPRGYRPVRRPVLAVRIRCQP